LHVHTMPWQHRKRSSFTYCGPLWISCGKAPIDAHNRSIQVMMCDIICRAQSRSRCTFAVRIRWSPSNSVVVYHRVALSSSAGVTSQFAQVCCFGRRGEGEPARSCPDAPGSFVRYKTASHPAFLLLFDSISPSSSRLQSLPSDAMAGQYGQHYWPTPAEYA
jgi:hypothetical protein